MAYERPTSRVKLSKQEKLDLLEDYIQHYRQLIASNKAALNQKIPRQLFADLLDQVGETLLTESAKLATSAGPIRTFLEDNPLPRSMDKSLPDDFRVFCLALNSLKQWVAAEQAATDRYLLGGGARELCREAVKTCLMTDSVLGKDSELHHPVRDGRPPILLSKKGHDSIEDQLTTVHDDPIGKALGALRGEMNRSWAQLRRGCLDLLGKPEPWPSKASAASARAFAKRAAANAGVGYDQILKWIDSKGYGAETGDLKAN
ncbi:MAG TPA: hypothetical protein VKD23_18430 [Terriglobales bacterium]|nr:hypothetical protein [Terriglobales bacterium]